MKTQESWLANPIRSEPSIQVEAGARRDEDPAFRQQARDLLRLAAMDGQGRLSQEGRRLLYRLAVLVVAMGVQQVDGTQPIAP
jgi:hypothetical protein